MSATHNVAFVVSNKAISSVTGWQIGFWLAELTQQHSGAGAAARAIEALS
jgi:hypothetical protein